MGPVTNLNELTQKTAQWLHDLETDALTKPKAAELFNGAGKINSMVKSQLEACALAKIKPKNVDPNIGFLKAHENEET